MGLISGILMGMICGIGLMAVWKHMTRYRSNKRIAKAVDVKVMGCLCRDDLKKVCGDNFPEWISFPVYEQVKWLNKQLSKLWPSIAEAGEAIIKESVEPLLEDYRPPGITSLKFSKLSLGTVAPKIEGICVQSLKKGQITMDIDLRWGGDPNIVLGVEAAMVASIPIQLKNLQVFTVIRVIFQLTEEIPCISAVVVALLSEPKPRIDYVLKAVGGSLTALPGLSDMIDDTVNTIVTDMLEWPQRIVVPIAPVDTRYLHFYEYSSDQALHLSVPYLLNPCNVLMAKVDFGLLQFATYKLAEKNRKQDSASTKGMTCLKSIHTAVPSLSQCEFRCFSCSEFRYM